MTVAGNTATTKALGVAELRRLPVHRHAGIFRVLDGDERDRLRASMGGGYDNAHPIVVWKRTGEIVDGRNRRDLAVELKCTNVPVVYVAFPSEDAVTGFIVAQNLARRHLTTRERSQLAGQLVVNGASVRTAARSAGVSKSTTQRAANKARAGVPDGTPARRRTAGADGKSYPATKATKPASSTRKAEAPKTAAQRRADEKRRLSRVDDDLGARVREGAMSLDEAELVTVQRKERISIWVGHIRQAVHVVCGLQGYSTLPAGLGDPLSDDERTVLLALHAATPADAATRIREASPA